MINLTEKQNHILDLISQEGNDVIDKLGEICNDEILTIMAIVGRHENIGLESPLNAFMVGATFGFWLKAMSDRYDLEKSMNQEV